MLSFSFGLKTGYFASRLMSSWAIAEVTSDIGLDMMKPLLSSADQKKSELQN